MRSSRQIVLEYHSRTEHRVPDRFARSLGHLDWDTQPDPFLRYENAPRARLPEIAVVSGGPTLDDALAGRAPTAALDVRTLSQLLYDSLAISAWKQHGASKWALRCNPSSGNLHPSEAYVLLPALAGISVHAQLAHYAPFDHALETRRALDDAALGVVLASLCPGGLLLGLTSIHWREAWKYGERAYRYCQHDLGHAIAAIAYAAAALGWHARRLPVGGRALATLLAVDEDRGPESEHSDVLLAIGPSVSAVDGVDPDELATQLAPLSRARAIGHASALSSAHHDWPVIDEAARACVGTWPSLEADAPQVSASLEPRTASVRALARERRSAVRMDPRASRMRREDLLRMLGSSSPMSLPLRTLTAPARIALVLFVHRVDGLEPGVYAVARGDLSASSLRSAADASFSWHVEHDALDALGVRLYALAKGDVRDVAAALSCGQRIASDGCFAVSMIADLEGVIAQDGAQGYRRVHWEAGAIGQVLYLESEAAGLHATGIGCFFDDGVRRVMGLEQSGWRALYHFTVGVAEHDTRLGTLSAYHHRSAE